MGQYGAAGKIGKTERPFEEFYVPTLRPAMWQPCHPTRAWVSNTHVGLLPDRLLAEIIQQQQMTYAGLCP